MTNKFEAEVNGFLASMAADKLIDVKISTCALNMDGEDSESVVITVIYKD